MIPHSALLIERQLIQAAESLGKASELVAEEYRRARWRDAAGEKPSDSGQYLVMTRASDDSDRTGPVDFTVKVFSADSGLWEDEATGGNDRVAAWRQFDTAGMPEGV